MSGLEWSIVRRTPVAGGFVLEFGLLGVNPYIWFYLSISNEILVLIDSNLDFKSCILDSKVVL